MDEATRIVHCGVDRDPFTGASSIPIYQASTFHQKDVESPGDFDYTRSGNPTRQALEKAAAELEGGAAAYAFASGMAAVTSVFMLFQPGDHIVATEDLYGGTARLLTKVFSRWGLQVTFVNATSVNAVERAITPKSRAVFVETPSNPLLKITDLKAVAALARDKGLLSIVDNTFCTPYLQKPIELGFDIVLHSATKFLNGHSDILAGLAIAKTDTLAEELRYIQNACGSVLGVQDSWLLLRGLRTLGVRMEAAQKNAGRLATEISRLPGVQQVFYPALPEHPGHAIHMAQAKGGGAVISFALKDGAMARKFLKHVQLPLVGVSLGGVESILSYPATMSHAAMPQSERLRLGITDAVVRLSAGLEAPEDIIEDFSQALWHCSKL